MFFVKDMYWLITIPPKNQSGLPVRFVIDDLSKVKEESFLAERIDIHFTKVN